MIAIVMKPVASAGVVKGEGLYKAVVNRGEALINVRARNALEAEKKLMVVFRHELANRTIDFNNRDYPDYDGEPGKPPERKGLAINEIRET